MTLDDIKNYLKVDHGEDDALIQSLIAAARQYIEKQTGKIYKPDDEVWNICIKLMVAHWYENRGIEVAGTIIARIGHTVDALINHIAMCGDY